MREINPHLLFFLSLEIMRVKIFEGRKGSGDGLMPQVKQSLEKSRSFERSHNVEDRRIVTD